MELYVAAAVDFYLIFDYLLNTHYIVAVGGHVNENEDEDNADADDDGHDDGYDVGSDIADVSIHFPTLK